MDSHDKYSESDRPEGGGAAADAVPLIASTSLETVTRRVAERLARDLAVNPSDPLLPTVHPSELDEFCDLLVAEAAEPAQAFFADLRRDGMTLDALCLSYLAPAARRLGELWCLDEITFLEVTLGSTRLHGLLRTLRPDFTAAMAHRLPAPTALFAAVPGETHVLGVTMAADFFRRAGWVVDLITQPNDALIVQHAQRNTYDLVGLTAGCEAAAAGLEELIQRLRDAAPEAKLVLGGYLSALDPDKVARLDVDAVLTDISTAPFTCQGLLTPSHGQ